MCVCVCAGGSGADSVLSQIAAQRKRAAGLLDSRTVAVETPSPVATPLPSAPDISPPDSHGRRVCVNVSVCVCVSL